MLACEKGKKSIDIDCSFSTDTCDYIQIINFLKLVLLCSCLCKCFVIVMYLFSFCKGCNVFLFTYFKRKLRKEL